MEAAKKNETKAAKPADAKGKGEANGKAGQDSAKTAALKAAVGQIEREFGQGSLMRLGDRAVVPVATIPTGALSIDLALGVGGVPRGRIIEIFGPESSGKTTLVYEIIAQAQKMGGICAFIDTEHAIDPIYARTIGVDIDELLVSQPDHGEQALEIADVLTRSGAVDVVAVDSVAALTPRAELEGADGRPDGRPAGAADVTGHAQADRQPEPRQHGLHLHEPDPREGRGHVRFTMRPSPAAAR